MAVVVMEVVAMDAAEVMMHGNDGDEDGAWRIRTRR